MACCAASSSALFPKQLDAELDEAAEQGNEDSLPDIICQHGRLKQYRTCTWLISTSLPFTCPACVVHGSCNACALPPCPCHIMVLVLLLLCVQVFDIVGPVCESADFLGKERELPTPSELLVVNSQTL